MIPNRAERRRLERAKRKDAKRLKGQISGALDAPESDLATVMVKGDSAFKLAPIPWTPFKPIPDFDGVSRYANSRYIVSVYPPERLNSIEGFPKVVSLSFKHVLNIAITDFRDMMAIKGELVGPEAYSVQVFPPESQLVDMANQYHLWCLVPDSWPNVEPGDEWPSLPIGFHEGRRVSQTAPKGGRQRTFEDHVALRPDDVEAVVPSEVQDAWVRSGRRGRVQHGGE